MTCSPPRRASRYRRPTTAGMSTGSTSTAITCWSATTTPVSWWGATGCCHRQGPSPREASIPLPSSTWVPSTRCGRRWWKWVAPRCVTGTAMARWCC
ncbi:hypothetical protein MMEU_5293 [Mycobacterium marinum str. Europe]|nr:hypothetical protein MMEU_5293 [Mycobacterium marinum str. Europe]